jgi:hypothetical protein
MKGLVPKVSRTKRGVDAELVLFEACKAATAEGRPFTILPVNDPMIGVCEEITIWYFPAEGVDA